MNSRDRLIRPLASQARPTVPRALTFWRLSWGRNRLWAAYIRYSLGAPHSIRIASRLQVHRLTRHSRAHGIFTHEPCQQFDESRICRTPATFRTSFPGFKLVGLNRDGD